MLEAAGQTAATQAEHEDSRAAEGADEKTRETIKLLEDAEEAAEEAGAGDAVRKARRLVEEPCPKSAANALMQNQRLAGGGAERCGPVLPLPRPAHGPQGFLPHGRHRFGELPFL